MAGGERVGDNVGERGGERDGDEAAAAVVLVNERASKAPAMVKTGMKTGIVMNTGRQQLRRFT